MCEKINIEDMLCDKKFWEYINTENDKIFLAEIEISSSDCRYNKCICDKKHKYNKKQHYEINHSAEMFFYYYSSSVAFFTSILP